MLLSEGQLALVQNEVGFQHVVFRRANSLATKWLLILKGLSTTETLKKTQNEIPNLLLQNAGHSLILKPCFIPGNSTGAQGLPFCAGNWNGDGKT